MKKMIAIFFITLIGSFFVSSSLYAYGSWNPSTIHHQTLTSPGSFGLMKFEVNDGMEEVDDDFPTDFSQNFLFSSVRFYTNQIQSSLNSSSHHIDITCPIYLSSHSLRI